MTNQAEEFVNEFNDLISKEFDLFAPWDQTSHTCWFPNSKCMVRIEIYNYYDAGTGEPFNRNVCLYILWASGLDLCPVIIVWKFDNAESTSVPLTKRDYNDLESFWHGNYYSKVSTPSSAKKLHIKAILTQV